MNSLIDTLDSIYNYLQNLNRPVINRLQSGLKFEMIKSKIKFLQYKFTKELSSLYEWRNGTKFEAGDKLNDIYFFPGFYLLSLDEAINAYKRNQEFAKNNPDEILKWPDSWFPFFANGGGDYYLTDLQKNETEKSSVIYFAVYGVLPEIEYINITNMIQIIEECYRQGIIFLTKEGYLDMDDDAYSQIAEKYNSIA